MKPLLCLFVIVPSFALSHPDYVALSNFRTTSPPCKDKFSISKDSDGATVLTFDKVRVERGEPKPFARCRLLADLFIPTTRQLKSDVAVTATIHGHFEQIGDQVGARLLLSVLDQRSTAFISEQQTDAITSGFAEEHELELRASFPQLSSTQNDRTITLSIQLEAMINYRLDHDSKVSASLESLRFLPISLLDSTLSQADGEPS